MPTLKEVIADKAKFQDNLAWNLGDSLTVTLGQLRSLSAEDQAAITKREEVITKAQKDYEANQAELKKAQVNTANLYTTMTKALEAMQAGRMDDPSIKQLFGNNSPNGGGNNSNDPFAALSKMENDTLLGPFVSVVKSLREEVKKAQESAASVIGVQSKMAEAYLNETLEDRYDRLVPAAKQDKISLESLITTAVTNKQFTRGNVPNIKWAYQQATAGDTAAAREAEIRADERKKLEAELVTRGGGGNGEIFVPTPNGNFGLDVHNRSGKAPQAFKSLDDAFAAAAKDKDIWANVDQQVQ